MKIKLTILLLTIYSFCFGSESEPGSSYIKNRLNFKLGYAGYYDSSYDPFDDEKGITANLLLHANYGMSETLEGGVYLGYMKIENRMVDWADSSIHIQNNDVPGYGITGNFHFLPFLVHKDDFRFDLYATGRIGGLFFSSPRGYYFSGNRLEYNLGGGMSFYITKHIGVYAEYTYGNYLYNKQQLFRYGFSLKF